MRRYQPLLLIAFFFLVTLITGITYLSGYAGRTNPDNVKYINVAIRNILEFINYNYGQEYIKETR